jgi:hypothetical protein
VKLGRTLGFLVTSGILLVLLGSVEPTASPNAQIVTEAPLVATSAQPEDETCDGNLHIFRKFRRGRQSAVGDPTLVGNDLWILHSYRDGEGQWHRYLKKWDGVTWSRIALPTADQGEYFFTAMDVTQDGAVWLAGWRQGHTTENFEREVIFRWSNGTWEEMDTPDFPYDSPLWDIEIASPTEGWAVGEYEIEGGLDALTMRWDGQTWTRETAPDLDSFDSFRRVSIASTNDVWAVGGSSSFRWNGSEWTKVRLPKFNGGFGASDVDAESLTEAWAVGFGEPGCCPRNRMVRWNGEGWIKVPTPNPKGVDYLTTIDVEGTAGWSVGQTYVRNIGLRPLARFWDGSEWSWARVERGAAPNSYLRGVVTASDGSAWATGAYSWSREHGVLQHAC